MMKKLLLMRLMLFDWHGFIYQMKKIAFIHPDLGIGGAEQLVVNLCLAAKKHNYEPHIFTPYHHQSFPQTHDGTIIVHQHGSFFGLVPDTIRGKFKGILAYIRSLICVMWLILYNSHTFQVVVADQVSVVLPLLRLFGYKTIFYCHYPDKLLSGNRGFFKKIYRFAIDLIQEISLLFAQKIYVNSLFTQEVFYKNFRILNFLKVKTTILYPSIDLSKFDQQLKPDGETENIKLQIQAKYFFSLNRYERKKNINLALEAYSDLISEHPELKSGKDRVKLVIAGGYDLKVSENIEHKKELQQLAEKLGIKENIHFYTAISNEARKYLLRNAECVLYTPENEHFGIVPCQAMYSGVPIIADNSGGPRQSVGKGCGFLCSSKKEWKESMWKILSGEKKNLNKGRDQVFGKFSFEKFSSDFVEGIEQVCQLSKKASKKQ